MKTKLLCLHGFLGAPSDFDFLSDHFQICAPDLNDYVDLGINEICENLEAVFDFSYGHLLGYSFGSRLGLQIFNQIKSKYKGLKILCLAGHMGLEEKDRGERLKFEQKMITFINSLPSKDFIQFWNSLELFQNDQSIFPRPYDKEVLIKYFDNFGLSKQPMLKAELLQFKEDIMILYGELDKKYLNYAQFNLSEFSFKKIDNLGHRLLQGEEQIILECKGFFNV